MCGLSDFLLTYTTSLFTTIFTKRRTLLWLPTVRFNWGWTWLCLLVLLLLRMDMSMSPVSTLLWMDTAVSPVTTFSREGHGFDFYRCFQNTSPIIFTLSKVDSIVCSYYNYLILNKYIFIVLWKENLFQYNLFSKSSRYFVQT